MAVSARVYIAVPVFNRIAVACQCIPTLIDSMADGDQINIYDDGCTEDVLPLYRLIPYGPKGLWRANPNIGVNAQRREHIMDFWKNREHFTHLYFTDADAIHDPHWRSRLLDIQENTGLLACGYHTQTHENYTNNVYHRKEGIVFTRFAPGVSYLLSREMVERIMAALPAHWDFDWAIPSVLGYRCAVSDVSCVDHLSRGGLHHDGTEGWDGGDRALNPTPFLIAKRREIIAQLESAHAR